MHSGRDKERVQETFEPDGQTQVAVMKKSVCLKNNLVGKSRLRLALCRQAAAGKPSSEPSEILVTGRFPFWRANQRANLTAESSAWLKKSSLPLYITFQS
jgi:hypothetical protein